MLHTLEISRLHALLTTGNVINCTVITGIDIYDYTTLHTLSVVPKNPIRFSCTSSASPPPKNPFPSGAPSVPQRASACEHRSSPAQRSCYISCLSNSRFDPQLGRDPSCHQSLCSVRPIDNFCTCTLLIT